MEKSEEASEKLKAAVENAQEYLNKSDDLASAYVTQVVSPVLEEWLEDFRLQMGERHKVDESYKHVIHYTSIDALVSMLENATKSEEKSSLRLYDSMHMNDPDEGNYLTRNLKEKYDWLEYDWLWEKEEGHAYVASFILDDQKAGKDISDDLVFWCAYGKEGEGCSLSLPIPPILHSQLKKVLYGAEGVEGTANILSPVLDSLDSLRKNYWGTDGYVWEELARVVVNTAWEFLEEFRYLYKDEAYRYENECRFVLTELTEPDIRENIRFEDHDPNKPPGRIRHYYEPEEIDIKELLVTGSKITLGPCVPHADSVKYHLSTLLRRVERPGPKIKISQIPYRKS